MIGSNIESTPLEGRIIAVALMITGIDVIGVFTATVASFFFEREQRCDAAEVAARLEVMSASSTSCCGAPIDGHKNDGSVVTLSIPDGKRVRDRIERVAATDFTILIEGAIGPQPHPNFIDLFSQPTFGERHRAVARAGEDGQATQRVELKSCRWRRLDSRFIIPASVQKSDPRSRHPPRRLRDFVRHWCRRHG